MTELMDDIKIFLKGQLAIQFFREKGIEYMTDRYLRDFSAAWGTPFITETEFGHKIGGIGTGNIDPAVGQAYLDYEHQERQRQKASSSVSSLDASGVTILIDPASGDMTLQQGHNHIVIKNGDLPALAGDAMRATPATPAPVAAPTPAAVQGPKFQGDNYQRQARRNEETLAYAVEQEKRYHQTIRNWPEQDYPSR